MKILFIVVFLLQMSTNAQKRCGTQSNSKTVPANSEYKVKSIITIPVVFHVIYKANGEGNVPISQLEDQIDVLNLCYNGSNYTFHLATVSRTENDTWHQMNGYWSSITSELSVDPKHVLNIYIGKLTGYLGIVHYKPWQLSEDHKMHGVFIDYRTLPGGSMQNYNEGKTAVHEVGHYLGLYHTFKGGCIPPGDEVDDTPYHLESIYYSCPPEGTNTCSQTGDDPIHNYMNYVDDPCMYEFTTGQLDRIDAMVGQYKPSLGGSAIEFSENSTIAQEWSFWYNVSVLSGATLVIKNGSSIRFYNNSSLTINGTLNVVGYSSFPVIIDFTSISTSNGIKINPGGETNIQFAVIKNARYGIYSNSGVVSVLYCNINNSYYGLYLYYTSFAGSNSLLDETYITNNSQYGIYLHSSNPTITNCNISNNKYGIRIYNSYSPSWTTVHISDNTITNSAYYGLYCYNSSPTFQNNTFSGNKNALWISSDPIFEGNSFISSSYYGLACYGSASPDVHYNSTYNFGGYNTITNNNAKGVRITGSSNPDFGQTQSSLGGFNSIYGNSGYEMENTTSNTINAQHNWWGSSSGPQSGDLYGSFLTFRYLDYDPNGGSQSKSTMPPPEYAYDKNSDLPEDLQIADFEQDIAEYKSSAEKFKNHFTNNKESRYNSFASVQYIKSLSSYLEPKAVVAEIEKTLSEKQSEIVKYELLSGLASKLSIIDEGKKAIEKLDEALNLKIDIEKQNRLSAQKGMIYVYNLNEKEKGKVTFEEIQKSSSKESPWYELAQNELDLLNEKSSLPKMNVQRDEEVIPGKYDLIGNYPNPFNPSTTISYSLPSASNVKLEIYDVMGRMIKSFTTNSQASGTHQVVWDGTNSNGVRVSSGIYIYRFEAESLENNERFVKSNKLILLR